MILPNKYVRPTESLIYISKFILESLQKKELSFDELYDEVKRLYPKCLNFDSFVLSINFLYIIGRIEESNETIRATF